MDVGVDMIELYDRISDRNEQNSEAMGNLGRWVASWPKSGVDRLSEGSCRARPWREIPLDGRTIEQFSGGYLGRSWQ